jgi:hypothetical protein
LLAIGTLLQVIGQIHSRPHYACFEGIVRQGHQKVLVFGYWIDFLSISVYREETLIGKTGYGNLPLSVHVSPVQPGGQAVDFFPLNGSQEANSFFTKSGTYKVATQLGGYYAWNEKEDKFVLVKGKSGTESDPPELSAKGLVVVRHPTEKEKGAWELLEKSPKATWMIGLHGECMPLRYAPDSSEEGTRVLKRLVEQFPGTIYTDFANFALGRTLRVEDDDGAYLAQETSRAQIAHLNKVGQHSRILRQRAAYWKWWAITTNPGFFPETDWKAAIPEVEGLAGDFRLFGYEENYEKQILPVVKAMAKDGRLDLGDLPGDQKESPE